MIEREEGERETKGISFRIKEKDELINREKKPYEKMERNG